MTDHEDTRPLGDARDDERGADGEARARAARPGGRGGGLRARWQRASSGRRAGTAAAAGLVAAALVVAGGLAAQPEYPEGDPADGVVVDELRSAPVAEGWRIDPADLGATDVQPGCLDLRVLARAGDDVLVLTTTQLGTATTGCFDRAARGDRLARVDPRTGDVRWSTATSDVSDVVSPGQLGAWVDDDASTAVVANGTAGLGSASSTVARLDLATGLVLERYTSPAGPLVVVEVDDRWVLTQTQVGGGGDRGQGFVDGPARTLTTVLAREDVGRAVWQTALGVDGHADLVGGGVLVVADGAGSLVDPETGAAAVWGEPWRSDSATTVDGDVVFVDLLTDGTTTTSPQRVAHRLDGRETWRRDSGRDEAPVLSGDCVLFSEGASLTCVDRDTGDERWTVSGDPHPDGVPAPAPLALEPAAGQRGGDVLARAATSRGDDGSAGSSGSSGSSGREQALLVLDADTGAERTRIRVPVDAAPLAMSRTVLAVTTGPRVGLDGGVLAGAVAAYDLADGRALWRLTPGEGDADGMRDLQFWGGTLVAVGDDGVVTQLVDDTRVVG
ncbi:PQQ-binding-like beta-propeller repeat protein [Frigoribacterium sp. CFBP 13729]|uniref:PQQ-binding-like beta-propeller repeat protein n=1 Tax=Frigoribacterium sp. CFBP 13729 TaxID=2775293 RepID=UPI00177F0DDC|nr:PQQ-binding-like beta-propeller repeat protein [Frigoribacterium sp. CFBP 13729]